MKGESRPIILLVCLGNLCRSPMAEGFLREKLRREGREAEYQVRSAGTWASNGQPASAYAIQTMLERGIDISGHRSHSLTKKDVEEADLILVMNARYKEAIHREFFESKGRTYLLSEMVGQSHDIADPYGGPLVGYRRCAEELEQLIEKGYAKILKLADSNFRKKRLRFKAT